MESVTLLHGFLFGIGGGFLAELVGLYKLRRETKSNFPKYYSSPIYWVITLAMILTGGGLVILYIENNISINAILAVNIGASAPIIIGNLVANAPEPQPRID